MVDVLGSDGCNSAAGYHLMSKPSEREIPDHALAYDSGITEVSMQVDGVKVVLYNCGEVSVYNLQPVLRAVCNENDHFATHTVTLPIETARKLLCESTLEIKLTDKITLKTNSIEIVTSKLDKKYSDEQGGLGESNFPCSMCTASKEEIRDMKFINAGFPIDRTCSQGAEIAEKRRINPDKATQDTLKKQSKGWKSVPILSVEYIRRGFDDLHSFTSWGRWVIKIIVRLRAGLFSEKIEAAIKTLYDTALKMLRDELMRLIGIDIHLDLKGREAQALFALKNHEKVMSLIPEQHTDDFSHFLTEARFALAIVCHPDPAAEFDLPSAEPRLKRFQLWLVNTWPNFRQPEYVHPTLMHTVQLLTRPGALSSISLYGTQNKEAKNQKNNQYLANMARMTDLSEALEDVYTRDSQASSVEFRKYGETKATQHCKKCGSVGHRASNCPGPGGSRSYNQKFVDLDSLDPWYKAKAVNPDTLDPLHRIRDNTLDLESSEEDTSEEEIEGGSENLVTERLAETPRKSVSFAPTSNLLFFDETSTNNDSPAKRTRSKQKNIPTKGGDPSTSTSPDLRPARRKLDIG